MHQDQRRTMWLALAGGAATIALVPATMSLASTITGTDGSPPSSTAMPVTMANGQQGYLSADTPADHKPGNGVTKRRGKASQRSGSKSVKTRSRGTAGRRAGSGPPSETVKGENGTPPKGSRPVTRPDGSPGFVSDDTPADHKPKKAMNGRVRGNDGAPPPGAKRVMLANGQRGVVSADTPSDHVAGEGAVRTQGELVTGP